MPIGTKNDMKIYDPRIRGGFVETLLQNLQAFNASSRGLIAATSSAPRASPFPLTTGSTPARIAGRQKR